MKDRFQLETPDFKDLLRVGLLANSSLTKDRRQAMEIARNNPTVLAYSMATLEEELGLRKDYSLER